LPSFVEKILNFNQVVNPTEIVGKNEQETKKIQSGFKLISELKKMFGLMAIGNKAYVEPGPVLGAIIDDAAHQYQIGDERDLREFNEIFLSRITDAYKAVSRIN
jgi:hypothetical protein